MKQVQGIDNFHFKCVEFEVPVAYPSDIWVVESEIQQMG